MTLLIAPEINILDGLNIRVLLGMNQIYIKKNI